MKFQIVCDSAADLPMQYTEEHHVAVVPFYVSLDGTDYRKEGIEVATEEFYGAMIDHPDWYPKTSMPTVEDFGRAFHPFVKEGIPVLCICLTQTFSGSYQSALLARDMILDEYPEAEIHVMNSQMVTALEGVLVTEAVRLRDMDMELADAIPLLEGCIETGHIFFTTKDLKYLRAGGRLSGATYAAGKLLDIKPLLHFHMGDLAAPSMCRGRKRSVQKVIDTFFDYLKEHEMDLKGYVFGTGIGADVPGYDELLSFLARRMDELGIHPDRWIKIRIGSTIGVHTGPYPIGLGFMKKCEV